MRNCKENNRVNFLSRKFREKKKTSNKFKLLVQAFLKFFSAEVSNWKHDAASARFWWELTFLVWFPPSQLFSEGNRTGIVTKAKTGLIIGAFHYEI